jgi:hypothetical protein
MAKRDDEEPKIENADPPKDVESGTALGSEQVQAFRGAVPDPTPNENYTVAGVTRGAPTPETDADLQAEARRAARFR